MRAKRTEDFEELLPVVWVMISAKESALIEHVGGTTNGAAKARWLKRLGNVVGSDDAIPRDMEGLPVLPGIGRKSANVIIRESGDQAEGIVVDLHVVRTAARIGFAEGVRPGPLFPRPQDLPAEFPETRPLAGRRRLR